MQAAPIFQECLEISRQLGNGKGIRVNLGQLGETLTFLGAFEEAQTHLSEAWQRCEQAGDGIGMAWTLKRRGQLAKAQGRIEEGDRLIHEGMALLEHWATRCTLTILKRRSVRCRSGCSRLAARQTRRSQDFHSY